MKKKQKDKLKLKANQHVFYLVNHNFQIQSEGFYCSFGRTYLVVLTGTFLRSVFGYRMIKDDVSGEVKRIDESYVFLSESDAYNYAHFANGLRDAMIEYGTRQIINNIFRG